MAKKYDIIETTTVETRWGGEVTRKKNQRHVFQGLKRYRSITK